MPTDPAAPIVDGRALPGTERQSTSPIDGTAIGRTVDADAEGADAAMRAAGAAFGEWDRPARRRARRVPGARRRPVRGAPRPLHAPDARGRRQDARRRLAELREAVDFCRFYAAEARRSFSARRASSRADRRGQPPRLSRARRLRLHLARGISRSPSSLGQVDGGARRRQHGGRQAGRADAAHRRRGRAAAARGRRAAGRAAPRPRRRRASARRWSIIRAVAGVAFTGSTEIAWRINRALAAKDGPIVPLIAETGGINAMIVDATALPEQVADDVVASAFRSAGQRCSALRLLCLQEDVADRDDRDDRRRGARSCASAIRAIRRPISARSSTPKRRSALEAHIARDGRPRALRRTARPRAGRRHLCGAAHHRARRAARARRARCSARSCTSSAGRPAALDHVLDGSRRQRLRPDASASTAAIGGRAERMSSSGCRSATSM